MTPSFILQGTGVSGGVAMGRVAVVSHATFDVSQYQIENGKLSAEFARLDVAIKEVRKELETLRAEILSGDYIDDAEAFIGVQETLLNDSSLQENTKTYIAEHGCNVEWALVQQMGLWVAQFDQIEDEYLRERKYDVMQVVERVLKQLMGRRNETAFDHAQDGKIVLFAHDLSPTDLLHCKRSQLAAIVTDQGGVTSHTAIIARSIGVPALVGVRVARQLVRENEWVIVDGNQGSLVVSPGKDAVAEYREHYQ
ncbi:MAG: phosphoenolpyruvate--protein phosphotransferase, partial [Burkholderiales bacterium]|nr:phosphoenolpyruvate--protein phosphotransferase [Burkholderiales bacterium]